MTSLASATSFGKYRYFPCLQRHETRNKENLLKRIFPSQQVLFCKKLPYQPVTLGIRSFFVSRSEGDANDRPLRGANQREGQVCEEHPPVAEKCSRAEGRNRENHERTKRSEATFISDVRRVFESPHSDQKKPYAFRRVLIGMFFEALPSRAENEDALMG